MHAAVGKAAAFSCRQSVPPCRLIFNAPTRLRMQIEKTPLAEKTHQSGLPQMRQRRSLVTRQKPCAYRKFHTAIRFLHLPEANNDTIRLPYHSVCVIVLSTS
jgi:hypothetical protein